MSASSAPTPFAVTGGSARLRSSAAARLLATVTLALGILVVMASPARAHGGGGADASNYRSVVEVVTTADQAAEPSPQPVDVDGVTWSVLANDALLRVSNATSEELTVPGYEGEPYLRVGPEGVFENRNSPATYQNNDRFALSPVPDHASPEAEPDWLKVSDDPSYAWHDHRIHWMAPTLPPQVKVDPTQPQKVNDWSVPFTIGGEDLAVTGTLTWEPPPPWWPWVLGTTAAASAPVLLAFTKRDAADRRRFALRAAAGVFAAIIAINVVHGVDDLIAVPATAGQNLAAGAQTFLPLLIAVWPTVKAAKARPGAAQALLFGMLLLVIPLGLTHTAVLISSQIATTLPEWFTRLAVATQFAVIGPTIVAVLASGELRSTPQERHGVQPVRGVT